ncbi:DUF2975 domain-containing protein [Rhodohalobacter mucosus]|uniref:DUF2975 domain-containing protein n=1 Tax=Rhodohalobacter mucosus TaxID=2079485 RepID=A0A316TS51_9BACT|nr:DUF2975 domain-containing protein [Rhodohalobacter mucosus]PWN07377.1 hypothetical protein DDZ15_03685 [Rhodohalobacter mucosus]
MEKNRILSLSKTACRLIEWLCIVLMALLVIGFFYWLIAPDQLSGIRVSAGVETGYGLNGFDFMTADHSTDTVSLSELSGFMVGWIVFRSLFFLGITVLIIRKIMLVLTSIDEVKTFYGSNIKHFRDLSLLGFIAFIASGINFSYIGGSMQITLGLVPGPLLFSLACLVLAEVFREGKMLLEENNMII